jgi:D-sedoheptulose 7-phosphate isomerase
MHTNEFLTEAVNICRSIEAQQIERLAEELAGLRTRGGRLFILGAGGSAGNASHAVNDFRKLCHLECYAPTDNVAELTARTNDEGWETVFAEWLKGSRLNGKDGVLVLSVGGGTLDRRVSANIVFALQYARERGAAIVGIVGRDGGYTAQVADVCVMVPTVNPDHVTPHAEAFQAVFWHLFVSHPKLKRMAAKW